MKGIHVPENVTVVENLIIDEKICSKLESE